MKTATDGSLKLGSKEKKKTHERWQWRPSMPSALIEDGLGGNTSRAKQLFKREAAFVWQFVHPENTATRYFIDTHSQTFSY